MGRYVFIIPQRVTKQHLNAILNKWLEDGEFHIIVKSINKKRNGDKKPFQREF